MEPKKEKLPIDGPLAWLIPNLLLFATACAFMGAIIATLACVMIIINFDSAESPQALLTSLNAIVGLLVAGSFSGALLLILKYLARVDLSSRQAADALTRIVESQSRKSQK